jgi:hypothetical protein
MSSTRSWKSSVGLHSRRQKDAESYTLTADLDNGNSSELRERGFDRPQIAVITGMVKDSGTTFSARDYSRVRRLGNEYLSQVPRRIAR